VFIIYFKAFRRHWLRPYGWWWDELVEWRNWVPVFRLAVLG